MNIKIGNYVLDNEQSSIVRDESKYLLVVAGAGSGKTLTILGKIYYLVNELKVLPNEILCISFTNASSLSLKNKIKSELNIESDVFTFHKLAINILKDNNINFDICEVNLLNDVIDEFFNVIILNNSYFMNLCLYYFGIKNNKNLKGEYVNLSKRREFVLFKNLIATFLHLFKCNNYELSSFNDFLRCSRKTIFYNSYKKSKIFFIFAMNIYLIYTEHLNENNEFDFDDLIIKSSNILKNGGYVNSYKYIIIDEYQDTSYIRFLLVKSIVDLTNSSLMVVGDDFQSIYRFTGCDLSLFYNFQKYFYNAKIMKIQSTYRNSNELIKVAGNFIMRNKKQIKKNLVSFKRLNKPIKIIYYRNIGYSLYLLVVNIYSHSKSPIMVLGRNNNDINLIVGKYFSVYNNKIICNYNKNIDLYYLTVHKSKGLEEEAVVIINLTDNVLGFPNKIKDDKMIYYVSSSKEKFLYSEERRLFYVALTRTKNYVYLLVPCRNPSVFVKELLIYKKDVEIINIEKRPNRS